MGTSAFERGRPVSGVSRRGFLQAAGALGSVLAVPAWARSREEGKSLIQIYLPGGPSHLDTFDLKPDAPREIRGEFQPVRTKVPGLQMCEHLPRLARLADRFTVIRTVTGLPDRHGPGVCQVGWSREERSRGLARESLGTELSGRATASSFDVARRIDLTGWTGHFPSTTAAMPPHDSRSLRRYGADEWSENARFLDAARLVESAARHVAFSWGYWDTHGDNFGQLRRQLPHLDAGLAALILDLESRGLLDEVVILMCGEFGRTPKINNGAGRDHWTHASFALVAGGGLRHGQVIGATDRHGAFPAERPVTMNDVLNAVRTAVRPRPADQPAWPFSRRPDLSPRRDASFGLPELFC